VICSGDSVVARPRPGPLFANIHHKDTYSLPCTTLWPTAKRHPCAIRGSTGRHVAGEQRDDGFVFLRVGVGRAEASQLCRAERNRRELRDRGPKIVVQGRRRRRSIIASGQTAKTQEKKSRPLRGRRFERPGWRSPPGRRVKLRRLRGLLKPHAEIPSEANHLHRSQLLTRSSQLYMDDGEFVPVAGADAG
jgi:hypothetical protein